MSAISFAQNVNSLRHIDDIDRRLPEDDIIFAEVREVLRRHGAETKYGLTLLHKHFDLAEEEVMVEFTDVVSRTQVTKPLKMQDIAAANMIEVTWRLDDERCKHVCSRFCFPTTERDGTPMHDRLHQKAG